MKIIKSITEDEMVSAFLKGEIKSTRFGGAVLKVLNDDKISRAVIDSPDTNDKAENAYRRSVLKKYRGYDIEKGGLLFNNFPNDAQWKKIELYKDDFHRLKYIKDKYWKNLSGGTRRVLDGAKNILNGQGSGDKNKKQSNKLFWEAVESLKKGGIFSVPILVALNPDSELVVLEGHLRFTAYLMRPEYIPEKIEAIAGFSENFKKWDFF